MTKVRNSSLVNSYGNVAGVSITRGFLQRKLLQEYNINKCCDIIVIKYINDYLVIDELYGRYYIYVLYYVRDIFLMSHTLYMRLTSIIM